MSRSDRAPLVKPTTAAPHASPTLSPNDHLRLLVELLRPGGAELGRRWLSALLLAPPDQREAIVESVERRIVELYGADDEPPMVHVRSAPVQRDGHVEETVRSYIRAADPDQRAPARDARDERRRGAS